MGFESSSATDYSNIEVESILRLRPLIKKEREDTIVLEQKKSVLRNGPATVVLHPLHPSLLSPTSHRSGAEFNGSTGNTPTSYHFNHVLDENTSQDKIYYTLGLPLATAAMNSLKADKFHKGAPRNHLLVCMGVANSGKTYTCFGSNTIPKRRASQDGLVPRLVDSLFSQSKHHSSSGEKGFALQISVVQVTPAKGSAPHACHVQDLLATAPKSGSPKKSPTKRNLTVRSMAARFEQALPAPILSPLKSTEFVEVDVDDPNPSSENCRDVSQAREVLQNAMNASKKASKGRNFHLLITMQPVLNGTQFGDKISVLDMAGLEKEKRGYNRKESVTSKNQAANAAVLHCLRTLIHNTNVRNGKCAPLDIHCADDMASEISCVSQEKDLMHDDREKPVPFRQHKVSMLLQPMFASRSTTKVTILMTAYPGHADYQEKRLLLQDLELLHGSALIAAPARVATGYESQSVLSSESQSCLSSDTRSDDESAANERFDARKPRQKAREYPTKRSKSPSSKRQPPAYAPSFRNASSMYATAPSEEDTRVHTAPSAPSAPSLDEYSSKKAPSVSDFPGVAIPATGASSSPRARRQKTARIVSSNMTGGREAKVPPFYEDESKARRNDSRAPLGRSSLENGCPAPEAKHTYGRSKNLKEANVVRKTDTSRSKRHPGRSHNDDPAWTKESKEQCENPLDYLDRRARFDHSKSRSAPSEDEDRARVTNSGSSFTEPNADDQEWTKESKEQGENPLDNENLRVRVDRGYTKDSRKARNDSPNERIRKMALQMKEILEQKRSLEEKCNELEKQNKKLKIDLREAGRSKLQAQWTSQDEEEFLESRRIRREEQNLVKAPLLSHMQRVNYIYDIKNQWAMSNKPHFDLSFPNHFQRAPDLDIRDQKNKEIAKRNAEEMDATNTPADTTAKKLTYEKENHRTPPKARQKKAAGNNTMSALKSLSAAHGL